MQGIAFIVTSVFSGLAIGFLGMGWTLAIAIVFTLVALVHLAVPPHPRGEAGARGRAAARSIDFRGSIRAIRAAPGLFALIIFSTFNNLIGGVYMALMDPYGLTLFPVEWWGIVLGVTSTGFIIGGIVIAKFGLGRNPIRTMLLVVVVDGRPRRLFTIREWWWLYAVGIWIYMCAHPGGRGIRADRHPEGRAVPDAGPRLRLRRGVRSRRQLRSRRSSSRRSPQFWIIPYMNSDAGQQTWGWLLGDGEARGIALVFLFSGLVMVVVALLAFTTRSYRTLSEEYERAPEPEPGEGGDGAATGSSETGSRVLQTPKRSERTTALPPTPRNPGGAAERCSSRRAAGAGG